MSDDDLSGPGDDLPQLDFSTFTLSIIASGKVHLGEAPDPESGGAEQANLLLARSDIDLLSLLQEKTEGNLTGEEERLLSQGLYELRMRYVELVMVQKQREKSQASKPS